MSFRVRSISTREVVAGIPTPRLIEAGGGEAFLRDGVWFLHEPGHVSPDGQYQRVRVERAVDWTVDVSIQPRNPSDDEVEEYRDSFVVHAVNRPEAESLAYAAAHDDVVERYGDDYSSSVSIIRVREGAVL